MTHIRHRYSAVFAGALALLATLALAAPAAQAKDNLSGQLIGGAITQGSKATAPILLTDKSAKKLKLRTPLAMLSTKASKSLQAPSPTGAGTVQILASTLRSGDELVGSAKRKGKKKALMPTLKAKKLTVESRESRFSVDELTDALIALYEQVGALNLRVGALESGLADLRAEIEALKAEDASLQGQLDDLLGQITDLEVALNALTSVVGGLPTAEDLQDVIDSITALDSELQGQIDSLGISDIAGLQDDLTGLQDQITTLDDQVTFLCGLVPIIEGVCPT